MGNTIITANMNLPNPVPGVDTGPDYSDNIQSCFTLVDQHNHSSGYGVPINPSGLNINSDLPINGNNLTLIRSVRLQPQVAPLSNATDIGCLYESGVDLYYNDGSGNQIRITSGGSVNATSSGISSGTATASFVSSVLVVNSASNTPANIQCGSILLGNNTAGSNFLTLSPPSALGADYSLVLPSLPSVKSIMALDASGNMSAPYTVDNSTIVISGNVIQVPAGGISGSNIASNTITQSNLAVRPVATSVSAGGVAISSSSGSYSTTASTPTGVTNLSVTIVCDGSPVMILLQSDGTGNAAALGIQGSGQSALTGFFYIFRDASNAWESSVSIEPSGSVNTSIALFTPPGGVAFVDTPTPGSHTYTFNVSALSGTTVVASYLKLVAYEL